MGNQDGIDIVYYLKGCEREYHRNRNTMTMVHRTVVPSRDSERGVTQHRDSATRERIDGDSLPLLGQQLEPRCLS